MLLIRYEEYRRLKELHDELTKKKFISDEKLQNMKKDSQYY